MAMVDDMLLLCLLGDRAKDVLLKSDERRRVVVAVVCEFNFILRLLLLTMFLHADCEIRILQVQNFIHFKRHFNCIARSQKLCD